MGHLMMDSKGWPYDSFDCLSLLVGKRERDIGDGILHWLGTLQYQKSPGGFSLDLYRGVFEQSKPLKLLCGTNLDCFLMVLHHLW